MYTLNETIKLLTDVADGHDQIAMSGVGDLAEWNPTERNYPLLWIVPLDTETEEGKLGRTFRVGCFDRVIKGEEGQDNQYHEQEVLSDMEMVLLDFVAYFVQQDQEGFFTTRIANLTPATEQMDDRLAGYFVELTILHDWDFNKCQIPATIGSPASGVDGLTLYDFCDTSVFNRLTDAQKACLTTELCTPCEDATVQNNATPTWSEDIPSGDTYTLPQAKILDSDGTTTVLADYIPAADGFMFTASACSSPRVTFTGGGNIGYGEAVTIGCAETYDEYLWHFCSQDFADTHIDATGQNPSSILNWHGVWDVQLTVRSGSTYGYSSTTITVDNGLKYHNLSYVPNTGGGYVGTSYLQSLDSTFYWSNNNHFVLLGDSQLTGDGGLIFRSGYAGIKTFGLSTVLDDPSTGLEYSSSNLKWALFNWNDGNVQIKDGGSFSTLSSIGVADMKWFKIERTGSNAVLYYGDRPETNTWTTLYTYSTTESADLYLIAYLHSGSQRNYMDLYKFGSYA